MNIQKVVFIIPLFNAEEHIEDLVESLKEQSNPNWQAIFVNDMSTDNSVSVIKENVDQDDRFKLINNKNKKC